MSAESSRIANRRRIDRLGQKLTLYLPTQFADTSYGEGWQDGPQVTGNALVDFGGASSDYDGLFGVDVDADMTFYVRDDIADGVSEPVRDMGDAGEEGAAVVEFHGDWFRVEEANTYADKGAMVLATSELE